MSDNKAIKKTIEDKETYDFGDFKKILEILTGENGCPWDKVQTHETLRQYLIEECYEVLDAINKKDNENLKEELGDVLLQVVFHSVIAEKDGEFSLSGVIDGVAKKMIYRHPHIFSDAAAESPEEVLDNWEELKKKEKGYKTRTETLKNIPKSLPALTRAQKVLKKAETNDRLSSLPQILNELKDIFDNINTDSLSDNEYCECIIGDILIKTVKISNFLKINSEFALTNAVEKFINKFEHIDGDTLQK